MTNTKTPTTGMEQYVEDRGATETQEPEPREPPWFEAAMLEILLRPVAVGMAHAAHAEKEQQLEDLFERFTLIESWTLHKRLKYPAAEDQLAVAFARLIPERRQRLLDFLGDAKRRAAIRST